MASFVVDHQVPDILGLNNYEITNKLLEYIENDDSILFSEFTYPLLEQINEEGLHNKSKGKYFDFLRWLTISIIKNDKIINNKRIITYNNELQQILMSLEESSITGIIPIQYGKFKDLLEKKNNKDYFSCDEIYEGKICISNSHLVKYLQDHLHVGSKRRLDTEADDNDARPTAKRRHVASQGGKKTRKNKKLTKTKKQKRKGTNKKRTRKHH